MDSLKEKNYQKNYQKIKARGNFIMELIKELPEVFRKNLVESTRN